MQSAFIYSDRFEQYKLSENHPFDPVRGRRTFELCRKFALLSHPGMEVVEPTSVEMADLAQVHSETYLELLKQASEGEFFLGMLEYGIGTDDCPVFPGLLDFLRLCAGATVKAADLVADGGRQFAFNPLGGFHHAGRAMAEGFCYVNDIALVAKRWADRGLRVAVVDIDAHHGNGTQSFFYSDPRVLTISFHESGETLYPWGGEYTEIGDGPGRGFNVNVPLRMNSDDEIFLFAFLELAPPLLQAFAPDVVIGVMGVDTFASDPLTHLRLTNNSYAEAVRIIHKLAPRWIALGAGGYHLENVARGWSLLWAVVHELDRQDDATAMLGGVFIGETDLGVASLRDMTARTSGPEKIKALDLAEEAIAYLQKTVFPILGAKR